MLKKINLWRAVGIGAAATILLLLVDIAEKPAILDSLRVLLEAFATQLIVGVIIGALVEVSIQLYDIAAKLRDATEKALERLEHVGTLLEYHQRPLEMITNARSHAPTLGPLLKDSIGSEGFRHIPFVGPPKYLMYLGEAISHSRKFEGVQRFPIRWFRDTDKGGPNKDGANYLKKLAERKMDSKTRIFIVDDAEEMKAQLENSEYQDFYWNYSADVDTYWTSKDALKWAYPNIEIPEDFALFDSELVIQYKEEWSALSFDLIDPKDGHVSKEERIFNILRDQLSTNQNGPFMVATDQRNRPANAAGDPRKDAGING